MTKKVTEIPISDYVVCHEGRSFPYEPSKEEIERAIREKDFDERGFQDNSSELIEEWNKVSISLEEFCDRARRYHGRRIAFFVVNKWTDPIKLRAYGTVKGGLHRLKAAIYMGMSTVEVEIIEAPGDSPPRS